MRLDSPGEQLSKIRHTWAAWSATRSSSPPKGCLDRASDDGFKLRSTGGNRRVLARETQRDNVTGKVEEHQTGASGQVAASPDGLQGWVTSLDFIVRIFRPAPTWYFRSTGRLYSSTVASGTSIRAVKRLLFRTRTLSFGERSLRET